MAAGDVTQLPATIAASRSVEKALEEAAASGALNLSNRKLKEFPRTAKNYDLSDITYAGKQVHFCLFLRRFSFLRGRHGCLVAGHFGSLLSHFFLSPPPPAFSLERGASERRSRRVSEEEQQASSFSFDLTPTFHQTNTSVST